MSLPHAPCSGVPLCRVQEAFSRETPALSQLRNTPPQCPQAEQGPITLLRLPSTGDPGKGPENHPSTRPQEAVFSPLGYIHLLGHSLGHGHGGHSAGLCDADDAVVTGEGRLYQQCLPNLSVSKSHAVLHQDSLHRCGPIRGDRPHTAGKAPRHCLTAKGTPARQHTGHCLTATGNGSRAAARGREAQAGRAHPPPGRASRGARGWVLDCAERSQQQAEASLLSTGGWRAWPLAGAWEPAFREGFLPAPPIRGACCT